MDAFNQERDGVLTKGTFGLDERFHWLTITILGILVAAFIFVTQVPWRCFYFAVIPALLVELRQAVFYSHAELLRRANLLALARQPLMSASLSPVIAAVVFAGGFGLLLHSVDREATRVYLGPSFHDDVEAEIRSSRFPTNDLPIPERWAPHLVRYPAFFGIDTPITPCTFEEMLFRFKPGGSTDSLRIAWALVVFGGFGIIGLLIWFFSVRAVTKNHKSLKSWYRSNAVSGETLKSVAPRPVSPRLTFLFNGWVVALWLIQNVIAIAVCLLCYMAIAVGAGWRLLPGWEWIAVPFGVLHTACDTLAKSNGTGLYILAIGLQFSCPLLMCLAYASCGLFVLVRRSILVFGSYHIPNRVQQAAWLAFLREYHLPQISLRIVDSGMGEAFWYLNRPVVVMPCARLVKLRSHPHNTFLALHEVGHLVNSVTQVWGDALSTISFAARDHWLPLGICGRQKLRATILQSNEWNRPLTTDSVHSLDTRTKVPWAE